MKSVKTVSVEEMRKLDKEAIEDYGIPGVVLMENAGIRSVDIILDWYSQSIHKSHILVFCGPGNNGGDGYVIARHLHNKGFTVQVLLSCEEDAIKGDALTNYNILKKMNVPIQSVSQFSVSEFNEVVHTADFVIDAIFGIGLVRDIQAPISDHIRVINSSEKPIVAIDIPSGLDGDTGAVHGICLKADMTITMGARKHGFDSNNGPHVCGEIYVVDISLPKAFYENM